MGILRRMIKAILCDIDGTLVESNWLHAEAWQVALGAIGIHVELEEVIRQIGKCGDVLLRLREAGITLSLASSAGKADLAVYKKIAGIEDLIEEESSKDDAKESKPNPDIFEATLKRLELKPEEVLALGDTPWDAEAAGKAGIWTIGVETGGWTREELLEAGCVEVYKDVGELLDRFEESALVR